MDGEGQHDLFQLHGTGHADAGAVQAVQHWLWGVLAEQRWHHKNLRILQVHLDVLWLRLDALYAHVRHIHIRKTVAEAL